MMPAKPSRIKVRTRRHIKADDIALLAIHAALVIAVIVVLLDVFVWRP